MSLIATTTTSTTIISILQSFHKLFLVFGYISFIFYIEDKILKDTLSYVYSILIISFFNIYHNEALFYNYNTACLNLQLRFNFILLSTEYRSTKYIYRSNRGNRGNRRSKWNRISSSKPTTLDMARVLEKETRILNSNSHNITCKVSWNNLCWLISLL